MCGICGCGGGDRHTHSHHHEHGDHHQHLPMHGHGSHDHGDGPVRAHDHAHHHHHDHDEARVIEMTRAILGKNDRLAERARGLFLGKGVTVVNLVSSPGSGKTKLLEETVARLGDSMRSAIIVGDCATDHDARRLRKTGVPAIQVTTGNVCHLDAHMVLHAIDNLKLGDLDLLFIENVGNLVCPAAFDLGEDERIVLSSVTEGEDKPAKYPAIFHDADVVLMTKTDLAKAVDFNREQAAAYIRDAAPGAKVFELSARTGDGMDDWIAHLQELVSAKHKVAIA